MVIKDAQKLLNNKIVFYVVAALAIVNVAGYATTRSYTCLGAFAVSALVINHFLKNKVLALLGGLFVANFGYGCGRVRESFTEGVNHEGGKIQGKLDAALKAAGENLENQESEQEVTQEQCEAQPGMEWKLNKCVAKVAQAKAVQKLIGEVVDEVENMTNGDDDGEDVEKMTGEEEEEEQ